MSARSKRKESSTSGANRTIATNRKARFDYYIMDTMEAGLVLTGTEIKSLRAGRANIADAYARPQDGELWLHNAHIAPYPQGGIYNHEPTRPRKLLLHKDQLAHLASEAGEKGLTIVPLRMYIKGHYAKVEVGLAKGKRQYDKRRTLIDREKDQEARRALRQASR